MSTKNSKLDNFEQNRELLLQNNQLKHIKLHNNYDLSHPHFSRAFED